MAVVVVVVVVGLGRGAGDCGGLLDRVGVEVEVVVDKVVAVAQESGYIQLVPHLTPSTFIYLYFQFFVFPHFLLPPPFLPFFLFPLSPGGGWRLVRVVFVPAA